MKKSDLPDEEIQEVADLEEDNLENEKKEVIIEPMDDKKKIKKMKKVKILKI
ncbi:hypothetical protein ACN2CX_01015 [Aliarcobacter butzleri]|uniref:hypothetical protein n=1 Tax=Aliarcobacter butzleri TaxID=28197 RepID=UPI003AFB0F98